MAGVHGQANSEAGATIWSAISIDIASTAPRCARADTSGGCAACGRSDGTRRPWGLEDPRNPSSSRSIPASRGRACQAFERPPIDEGRVEIAPIYFLVGSRAPCVAGAESFFYTGGNPSSVEHEMPQRRQLQRHSARGRLGSPT